MTAPASPPPHIAVVRFSALGDVVMVAAAVQALRRALPAATITWITSPSAHALLEGMDGVNFEVIGKPRTWADYLGFYRRFRQRRFDAVLAMQANLRINLLYPALRAPLKIGFDRARARELQWLFCNRRIPCPDTHLDCDTHSGCNTHLVDGFLAFVETLTGQTARASWSLPLDISDMDWAKNISGALPSPLIAVHPYASKAERNWLPERYAAVIEQAVARWRCGILLTGGDTPAERRLCARLAGIAPERTRDLCGQTTPKRLAALLGEADVLLAPDTGAVHIARAMGTPVVGLYAVAPAALSGPYRAGEYCVDRYPDAARRFLGKEAGALPWNTRVHHPEAMSLIGVDEVVQQIGRALARNA